MSLHYKFITIGTILQKVDCTELNIESNDDVEQPGTSQVAKVAPAEICSITEDIQDDINVLYDILKSKNGMDLPRETVEKVCVRN